MYRDKLLHGQPPSELALYSHLREEVYVNELPSASHVLAQLSAWVRDDDTVHPHKGLGMCSRQEHRAFSRCGATP